MAQEIKKTKGKVRGESKKEFIFFCRDKISASKREK
jgi:hypothetical protein